MKLNVVNCVQPTGWLLEFMALVHLSFSISSSSSPDEKHSAKSENAEKWV